MRTDDDRGVFTIQARRCLKCGRILTSKEAVRRGYGCQCAAKAKRAEEDLKPIPGQMGLFDFIPKEQEG